MEFNASYSVQSRSEYEAATGGRGNLSAQANGDFFKSLMADARTAGKAAAAEAVGKDAAAGAANETQADAGLNESRSGDASGATDAAGEAWTDAGLGESSGAEGAAGNDAGLMIISDIAGAADMQAILRMTEGLTPALVSDAANSEAGAEESAVSIAGAVLPNSEAAAAGQLTGRPAEAETDPFKVQADGGRDTASEAAVPADAGGSTAEQQNVGAFIRTAADDENAAKLANGSADGGTLETGVPGEEAAKAANAASSADGGAAAGQIQTDETRADSGVSHETAGTKRIGYEDAGQANTNGGAYTGGENRGDFAEESAKALNLDRGSAEIAQAAEVSAAANGERVQEGGQLKSAEAPSQSEAYSRIGQEILSRLTGKGTQTFSMSLEPAELGRIDVSMKMSDGKLIIDILAESVKTQQLLAGQTDKLIAALGLGSVQVENIHVAGAQAGADHQHDGSLYRQNEQFFMNFADGRGHEGGKADGSRGGEARVTVQTAEDQTGQQRAAAAPARGRLDLTA
ncbi:MAG: flagellar hook-length control protein FliK [Clostridiales Family XIII bacterium]|nr:flagellar hook-length control protein FliK [Clostridiales Family XIII bacterium]